MNFLLALTFILATAFDACMASSVVEAMNVASPCLEDVNANEKTAERNSSDQSDFNFCQLCYSCQHLLAVRNFTSLNKLDRLQSETPYHFFLPSIYLNALKRPPKV